jgi:hypothetical protein
MTTLGKLIQGQDISFDTHQAGDGQETRWRNVHLEKRRHGKRGKVRYPLFDGQPSKSRNVSDEDFREITREVRSALRRDEALTQRLAETIVDVVRRFSSGRATPEDARAAAKKIAGVFGLTEDFVNEVEVYARQRFVLLSTIHFLTDSGTLYQVSLSAERVEIRRVRGYFSIGRVPI